MVQVPPVAATVLLTVQVPPVIVQLAPLRRLLELIVAIDPPEFVTVKVTLELSAPTLVAGKVELPEMASEAAESAVALRLAVAVCPEFAPLLKVTVAVSANVPVEPVGLKVIVKTHVPPLAEIVLLAVQVLEVIVKLVPVVRVTGLLEASVAGDCPLFVTV